MVKQIWLNLPVKDVAKARGFFMKIGFSFNDKHETPESTCLIVGDNNFPVMLFQEKVLEEFSKNKITDTKQSNEILISIDAQSREEVDALTDKIRNAGGIIFSEPAEIQGWMYGSGFQDLDGHRWNILFMDMSKMPK
jgi:predicted lactoylglutathione lyase